MRVMLATGLACLLAVGASACGGSGPSGNGVAGKTPDAIVTQAERAIDAAHSVRVSGVIPDGSSASPIRIDLRLVNGRGASGSLSENGVSFRLLTVGGSAYINGTPGFWRQFDGAAAAARLEGKWLRAPADSGKLASLNSLTDVRRLLTALLSGHGRLSKGSTTTLDGHPVLALHDTTRHGVLYVATSGPAYPIRIENTGAQGGQLDFTDFDAPVTLTPPRHSVDISSLH